MYCRNCGKEVPSQAVVCVSCGCPPKSGRKYCQSCGLETNVMAEMCTNCGVKLLADIGQKSKLVAGILGILFGGLGVHRFYLGYTGIGIVQIIVTIVTFGLGSLWGLVEGILILAGSFDKDAEGQPLKDN